MEYEYKTVGGPERGKQKRGAKNTIERVAAAMQDIIRREAAGGWEYVRTDLVPVEERPNLLSPKRTVHCPVVVFRRPKTAAPEDARSELSKKAQRIFGGKPPKKAKGGRKAREAALRAEADAAPISTDELTAAYEPELEPRIMPEPAARPAMPAAPEPAEPQAPMTLPPAMPPRAAAEERTQIRRPEPQPAPTPTPPAAEAQPPSFPPPEPPAEPARPAPTEEAPQPPQQQPAPPQQPAPAAAEPQRGAIRPPTPEQLQAAMLATHPVFAVAQGASFGSGQRAQTPQPAPPPAPPQAAEPPADPGATLIGRPPSEPPAGPPQDPGATVIGRAPTPEAPPAEGAERPAEPGSAVPATPDAPRDPGRTMLGERPVPAAPPKPAQEDQTQIATGLFTRGRRPGPFHMPRPPGSGN